MLNVKIFKVFNENDLIMTILKVQTLQAIYRHCWRARGGLHLCEVLPGNVPRRIDMQENFSV